jgi:hypothetical protein
MKVAQQFTAGMRSDKDSVREADDWNEAGEYLPVSTVR